jgi:MSHA biogenesis protein MshP
MKFIQGISMKHLNQKGFTIVQAVFVIVVLGMLGAYMVTMSTVQQATSTQALMQARAYQAARAGLEWGVYRIVEDDVDSENETFDVGNFNVSVAWSSGTPFDEAGQTRNIYNIESFASYATPGSPDYVSRELKVTIYD